MSIRILTTPVLDCDGCDAVYADVVPLTQKHLLAFSARDGWTQDNDGHDYCPACSAKRAAERPPGDHEDRLAYFSELYQWPRPTSKATSSNPQPPSNHVP